MANPAVGAMMGLSLVAVPVFLDTNTQSEQLLAQFASLYDYGHKLMPTIAVATCALHGWVAARKRAAHQPWGRPVLAAVTTITMVPFTWVCMVSTNNALFQLHKGADANMEMVRALIARWQWLHVARSLFPLAGAIVACQTLLKELVGGSR
uniref:Anthrone oxygenase gedH n=1 Tax=Aspergillus terreus (strain NIH 2624 / FGSC A1156) TaxID=341663 RepID=GEDH_ASPTN|nr:RecName: Full=Anthrone oxygenase gedH; AltName: Full=Geodin synthesis protein H [Aspergillus terreus NIH2624]